MSKPSASDEGFNTLWLSGILGAAFSEILRWFLSVREMPVFLLWIPEGYRSGAGIIFWFLAFMMFSWVSAGWLVFGVHCWRRIERHIP